MNNLAAGGDFAELLERMEQRHLFEDEDLAFAEAALRGAFQSPQRPGCSRRSSWAADVPKTLGDISCASTTAAKSTCFAAT